MKRWLAAAALVLLLAAGGVTAFVLYKRHQGRDLRGSSTVEFVTTEVPSVARPKRRTRALSERERVVWPTFGYDSRRLRAVAETRLRPPFRRLWTFRARTLLEFPPAVAYGRLYFASNAGVFFAVDARTGKAAWRYRSGRCVASSPAVDDGLVYQTFLNRPPCNSTKSDLDGRVVAFDADTGRVRWRFRLGPSESSPVVAQGRLYVGDWRGKVYALDARTGRPRWSFQTEDKVKGGITVSGRRIYVGSYDHHVYALSARTGKLIWRAAAQDRLGSRGTFYSTAAAAYGRVFIGSTDGKVYSYGARSGALRWSHHTGGFVYGSPAVWRQRILVGSYDGYFYSFDAATGDLQWRFKANGQISGSATVLGGVVYFATLKQRTYALSAATGKLLWTWPDGKYSPVVADSRRVYLVGHTRVYGMVPR